jgi:hypothetical protein
MQSCNQWPTVPPRLHFEPPGLHCEPPGLHGELPRLQGEPQWVYFEPPLLLNINFDADPEPAYQNTAYQCPFFV